MNTMTQAAQDVLAERARQINAEGWTPEHDDEHGRGEMARAAATYAWVAGNCMGWNQSSYQGMPPPKLGDEDKDTMWPWDSKWWKPKSPRRDLVRAAALLLAEIERLDRAAGDGVAPAAPRCSRCYGTGANPDWPLSNCECYASGVATDGGDDADH